MPNIFRYLQKLAPLAIVLAIVAAVTMAARSPLTAPRRASEIGALPDDLAPSVARIDTFFVEHWKQAEVTPAPRADELQILRRLSLALHGAIPSLEEIREFNADRRPDRLQHWTRRLLADSRFADYFAERLARSMVGKEGGQFLVFRRDRFTDWLSEQLRKNTPFDLLVRQAIAETGLWTGNPATNFITAAVNEGDVDENKLAGKTVRAFLGQRIDCAQCHDHPFGHWKQHEFEGLAAFYGQVQTSGLVGVEDRVQKDGVPVEYEVEDRKTGEKRVVAPAVPFLADCLGTNGTRRQRLAEWITHPSNRRFERAIANRVWGLLFGRSYIEPVDDLPDPDDEQTDLLDLLGKDFREHHCDLRRLIQVIASSAPFQLDSVSDQQVRLEAAPTDEPSTLAGEQQLAAQQNNERAWGVFPLIRLRPEQVIGSLFQSSSVQTIDQNSHLLFRTLRLIQGGQFVNEYGDFGENELVERGGTIPQRLLMMNGELATGPTRSNPVNAVGRIALFASTDAQCIETAYLCCLTRYPAPEELAHFTAELKDKQGEARRNAVEDMIWSLYNTTEFSWNH